MSSASSDLPRAKRFRVPLHVLTAGGASFVLLALALILAWQAYSSTREIQLSSVDESVQHVARVMKDRVRQILDPAEAQLELLVHQNLVRASTLEQRLAEFPTARAVLAANPLLDAIYVGYPNGEFVLFRPLHDSTVKRVFRAPKDADVLVQTQTLIAGKMQGEFRYYDLRGKLIKQVRRDDYVFDPRTRPWYIDARGRSDSVIVDPYVYFTTRSVGTTLSRMTPEGVVVGLDATLQDISKELGELRITPGSRVVVVDARNNLLARDNGSEAYSFDDDGTARLYAVRDVETPAIAAASALSPDGVQREHRRVQGEDWESISVPVPLRAHGKSLRVLLAVPHAELFRDARRVLRRQLVITLLLILASVPAGVWVTRRITHPLRMLAEDTRRVAGFDFSTGELQRSRIVEVDLLATATMQMKSTIARFLEVSAALNSETRLERLLQVVLTDVAATAQARSGALYLLDDKTHRLLRSQLLNDVDTGSLYPQELSADEHALHAGYRVLHARESVVAQHASGPELVAVPLETLGKALVGVLVLELPRAMKKGAVRDPQLAFVEALSSTAAVAIETRHLVDSQKNLLEALIQLLAGAIDSKSPYTGGHCQRVPELTKMLVRAAHESTDGPFSGFHLSDEDWEAVHVGAWLHDCGKVTTPEFVVDKATKLETIYNRIHEVRTRFEVLKRDAEIQYWRARSQGIEQATAWAELQEKWKTLDEDFAFVAECNVGGESLGDDKIERLKRIAQRPWMRTLDDRLGLSRDEMRTVEKSPPRELPAVESVLADKPEHLIERLPGEEAPQYTERGFHVDVPQYKFNRGELYNLAVSRGTLTEEERFIINDHIAQTIIMLERLPFPKHLRNVPEIAGGHHERMDGRGYPKGLTKEQMSVPARIMAIADVFEALTAADRPYKPPKTLSESLVIMAHMVREHHLDSDLFELFLRSGVYRAYAERFMAEGQLDAVDIERLQALATNALLTAEERARLVKEMRAVS